MHRSEYALQIEYAKKNTLLLVISGKFKYYLLADIYILSIFVDIIIENRKLKSISPAKISKF